MKTKISYDLFKSSLTALERLQQFKIPFFRFYEEFLFSFGEMDKSDDSNCEFYLLGDQIFNTEETARFDKELVAIKNLDLEIEFTTVKLAKLLALKETEFKNNLELWNHNLKK